MFEHGANVGGDKPCASFVRDGSDGAAFETEFHGSAWRRWLITPGDPFEA
jgi:hypothetical protein